MKTDPRDYLHVLCVGGGLVNWDDACVSVVADINAHNCSVMLSLRPRKHVKLTHIQFIVYFASSTWAEQLSNADTEHLDGMLRVLHRKTM